MQDIASRHAIHNVFSDNGYHELVLLKMLGLHKMRREGNDAVDDAGREYEMKTVSLLSSDGVDRGAPNVTTEHTLTHENIDRFRAAHMWIVSMFRQSSPVAIYAVCPAVLEPYFSRWESRLDERNISGALVRTSLNNPSIPLRFIVANGVLVWRGVTQLNAPGMSVVELVGRVA
jgi:hypothetical protein